jgi:hypothetical protein
LLVKEWVVVSAELVAGGDEVTENQVTREVQARDDEPEIEPDPEPEPSPYPPTREWRPGEAEPEPE